MVWTVLLFAAPFCFYREYGELEVASCSALVLAVVTCLSLIIAAFVNPHAIPLYPAGVKRSLGRRPRNVLYAAVMQYAVFEMYAGLQDWDTTKGRGVVAHSVLGVGAILSISRPGLRRHVR